MINLYILVGLGFACAGRLEPLYDEDGVPEPFAGQVLRLSPGDHCFSFARSPSIQVLTRIAIAGVCGSTAHGKLFAGDIDRPLSFRIAHGERCATCTSEWESAAG